MRPIIPRPAYTLAALSLLWSAPAFADAAPKNEDLAALRADLDRERRAREDLEKRLTATPPPPAPPPTAAPPTPPPTAAPPIMVMGFAQVDWVMHRESSEDEVSQDGQPLNQDRFLLRRARLRGERDGGFYHGVVELDANTVRGPQVRPINLEATFKWPSSRPYARTPWALDPTYATKPIGSGGSMLPSRPIVEPYDGPWFMVTAGMFRTPFGFDAQEYDFGSPWLERTSMTSALFPDTYDLGLRLAGGYRMARWSFAVMNGDPVGERSFPGRDPNHSKDLVFRVGAASELLPGIRLEGGVSGLTGQGFHKGNPATADQIQWVDQNSDDNVNAIGEITVVPGSPAIPSQSFKRFAVGADLRASIAIPVLGDLDLRAEIVRSSNLDRGFLPSDPISATRDQRQSGVYLGAAQEITKWAQVGVRWDTYNPDADAREQEPFALVPRDPSVSTWSFTGVGRLGQARLIAQYDKRSNALGRATNGRPATLADDSFTLRAEVRF